MTKHSIVAPGEEMKAKTEFIPSTKLTATHTDILLSLTIHVGEPSLKGLHATDRRKYLFGLLAKGLYRALRSQRIVSIALRDAFVWGRASIRNDHGPIHSAAYIDLFVGMRIFRS